ncbi:acyl-CoA dehydrogenase, partial [Pseudomonas aeruginosa]|nr:acyl-CoA dehydrogenase [Pseudomonas aeruginosa]
MSEARLHSPDPRTPRPMAGWAASLRDSGLLALAVPRVFAGMERGWGEIFAGVRHLAEQELELARRLALHHLQIASIRLLGSPEQQRRLLPASVERRWLWSEAVDLRRAQPEAQEHWRGGFLVGGRGSDCFAVEDVDRLLISAWHAPSRAHLIAVAETGRAGIDISGLADGSGLFLPAGQRLHYQRLRLHPEDILVPPGLPPTPCGQLREGLTRLAQANLDLGQAARVPGDVAGQGEAPRLLALALRLVELAAESFQAAFARGGALTFRESAAAS